MTKEKYGKLSVVRIYEVVSKQRNRVSVYCDCICDCGNEITIREWYLKNGKRKTCGCSRKKKTKIDGRVTPEYATWTSMMQRCTNSNDAAYKSYGGRGIRVCDEWYDYQNFLRDMGCRPSPDFTLDRIENNKGYTPENCRWADKITQSRNQRINSRNKTGFRGVKTRKYGDKIRYIAEIFHNGRKVHLGSFLTLEEAAQAREEGEETYWMQTDRQRF